MNRHLLKKQVDDLFSNSNNKRFSSWKKYRSQIRDKLTTPSKGNMNKSPSYKSKIQCKDLKYTSPMIQAKKNFDRVFYNKSPTADSSLASVSEIEAKAEPATISLKLSRICEVLPLENINLIKQMLKSTLKDDENYITELKSLAQDILANDIQ